MQVIIVGAGEVGSNIAASLTQDHDVIVIDIDPGKVEDLNYQYDVLAIEGDGSSIATLREAGIDKADMLIASTNDDETNLITCGTAKTLNNVFTIARVRKARYLETWNQSEGVFGVDFMVSTNTLVANDIIRIVGLPEAINTDLFAGGKVQMAEFEVPESSNMVGSTVSESDQFETITLAAVIRNGDVIIAKGDTVIRSGDKVIIIGRSDWIPKFARSLSSNETPDEANDFVIVGGSDVGYQTARSLEDRGLKPRLIEQNDERARELAEELPKTVVMAHDPTDISFLTTENIGRADALITTTESDEKNLLISLLAKNIGVQRAVAIVEKGEYAELFEAVGIDVAINPREVIAEEIIKFTQERKIENISLIEGRKAEVLEIEIQEESILAGRPIKESITHFSSDVVIGAITRQHDFLIPRGDTIIEAGDHVVLFVAADAFSEAMDIV